ncbi:MAG: hypothetical protein ACE5H9_14505 [Anaerolineae bacterium]
MTQGQRLGLWLTSGRAIPAWLALAALIAGVYLAVSGVVFGFSGFPLDDAWIHQTYARNLGQRGQFAFVPGVTSTGSTAPLWTLLLSLGYLLNLPFKVWTHGLGIIGLGLSGWTLARLSRRLFLAHNSTGQAGSVPLPESVFEKRSQHPQVRHVSQSARRRASLLTEGTFSAKNKDLVPTFRTFQTLSENAWLVPGLTGLFLALEWHHAWAAVSGMETILFVWLSLLLAERYLAWQADLETSVRPGFILGVLGGLLALTRPEGLGLAGLIGLDAGLRWWTSPDRSGSRLFKTWASIGLGLLLTVSPYFILNLVTTGLLFPNTFYAKQREYAILLSHFTLFRRWLAVNGVTLIGAQALLLPGLVWALLLTIRRRRRDLWFLWAWWFSYLLLYALRLPVTYQHGRYEIPSLPWLILFGVWGTASLLRLQAGEFLPRLLSRVWALTLAALALAFVAVGAQAYARDVRIIDTEMVQVALWLRDNTAEDTVIAAHDIGAIGYFTQRPILDLAGLITPEVIPFIRDEAQLLNYSRGQQAEYLVTFPSWYPRLVSAPGVIQVYTTNAPWAPQAGGDNMAVYRLE